MKSNMKYNIWLSFQIILFFKDLPIPIKLGVGTPQVYISEPALLLASPSSPQKKIKKNKEE